MGGIKTIKRQFEGIILFLFDQNMGRDLVSALMNHMLQFLRPKTNNHCQGDFLNFLVGLISDTIEHSSVT